MPTFRIWTTGTYTYTRTITADTKEDAEEEFRSEEPSICYECTHDGLELDPTNDNLDITEVDGEDDDEF